MGNNEIKVCPRCNERPKVTNGYCRECRNAYTRQWRKINHEKTKDLQRKAYYKAKDKEPTLNRRRRLNSKYGLSIDQVGMMLIKLNNKCPTCYINLTPDNTAIDHDHKTSKVRGILCAQCNLALGHVKDSPAVLRQLAVYLERSV